MIKNEITISNCLDNAHEIVQKMDVNDCIILCDLASILTKDMIEEARDKVFKSSAKELTYTLPNGKVRRVVITHGGTKKIEEEKKEVNFQKAIDFALENNLHLPMIPKQVIEEKVDLTKLENESWFQEHVDQFVEKKTEITTKKSNNTIRGKYAE